MQANQEKKKKSNLAFFLYRAKGVDTLLSPHVEFYSWKGLLMWSFIRDLTLSLASSLSPYPYQLLTRELQQLPGKLQPF